MKILQFAVASIEMSKYVDILMKTSPISIKLSPNVYKIILF